MRKPTLGFGKILCCTIFIAFIAGTGICSAQVLFSDDFSSWDNYNFKQDSAKPPGGWSYLDGKTSKSFGGITHYAGEVNTPGRLGASDKSFKIWRVNDFVKGYNSELYYYGSLLSKNREIYVRWYMKIPSNFEVNDMNFLKMWRWRINNEVGIVAKSEIYMSFYGSTFSSSNIVVNKIYPTGGLTPVASTSSVRDGQWHCHEIFLKLNTSGKADGEVKYWIDGKQTKDITGCDWKADNGDIVASTSLGVGNTGSTAKFQNSWQAIEFDDYVVSTSYIGPSGSSSSSSSASSSLAPPPPPGMPWVVK